MADENSKSPHSQAQQIPLEKIHDLPGVFVGKQPDKSYGGLVTSIQAGGVKEPVVLRLREDGEYQLVTGYRRRRASELAKKQDIPALVYEMSIQEAQDYHHRVKNQPDMTIPGKLIPPHAKEQNADLKGPENPTTAPQSPDKGAVPAADNKAKGQDKPAEGAKAPSDATQEKGQATDPKVPEKAAAPAVDDKAKGPEKPVEGIKPPADAAKGKDQATAPKTPDKAAAPAAGDKVKGPDKPAEGVKAPSDAAQDKGQATASKAPDKAAAPSADDKGKGKDKFAEENKAPGVAQGKDQPTAPAKAPAPATVTGPAAKGPAGTAISQVLPERLSPPDEAAMKDFPAPKEGESIFVTLHPAYLVKSEYNTISVDPKSEDYQELKKSIELNGVKDPVLARIGDAGTLEIVSGQRRHMIATELNYPVPTIIQKISDPDVKILVADGNLHRPKISTYDLARSLRMKMEGMKQKSGRRKKGTFKAEELDSDVKLAQEMGMPVSKLNRLIRLSEATKDVCDRVDDNSLTLSHAHAISFLAPKNQDEVIHLMDLGAKIPVERIEYMKKVEKAGKLNEETMRDVVDGKNVLDPPKQEAPQPVQPQPSAPAASTIPPSPDVPQPTPQPMDTPAAGQPGQAPEGAAPATPDGPSVPAPQPQEGPEPADGKQERPEYTKVVLAGDRLRKYFPDVMMTPREIEESIYDALEERRQRQVKQQEKLTLFPKRGPTR